MNSSKVGGSWRTIKLPYSRISGTWRPVKQIYTKVNGVWKIAFDLTAADPFDGTGTLVKTPGNVLWESISGTWTQSGGNVSASTTSSIAAIETGTTDGEWEIDTASTTTGGPGVGFWITDQQTWWGVRYYTEQYFFTAPGTPFYYPYNCSYTFASRPAGFLNPAVPGTPANSPTYTCGDQTTDSRAVYGGCPVTSCPTCNQDAYFTFTANVPCTQFIPFGFAYETAFLTANCTCICQGSVNYSFVSVTPGTGGTDPIPASYNCPSISYSFGGSAYTYETSTNYPLPTCNPNLTNAFSGVLASSYCTVNPFGVGPSAGTNQPSTTSAIFKRGELVRSSSGSFSVVTSQDFGNVGNLYAKTYGNSIDFRQYSLSGRAGSASNVVTYATGGGSKGTKHGMIVTAVPFTQTYNIGRFKATP